jgi:hypothetical protein
MKKLPLCLVFLSVSFYCPVQAETNATLTNELSAKYKQASSEKEKMDICIQAIDQGVIRRGGSIEASDTVFGTSLSKEIPARGKSVAKGVVFFAENPPSPSEDIAGAMVGWYLVVEFDSRGVIQNYFLSNLHK